MNVIVVVSHRWRVISHGIHTMSFLKQTGLL